MPQGDLVLRTAQEIAKGAHQTAMTLVGSLRRIRTSFCKDSGAVTYVAPSWAVPKERRRG